MDAAGLAILRKEMEADCGVIADAAEKAGQRVHEEAPGQLEAAAYELARLYNVFERLLERICTAFENRFEKRGDYHEQMLQRLSLRLDGIRPAFLPAGRLSDLRELKGFRHLVRHAYDLTLRRERLRELAELAHALARDLPRWCDDFVAAVREEQQWNR